MRGLLRGLLRSHQLYLLLLLTLIVVYFSSSNPYYSDVSNLKLIGAVSASLGVIAIGSTLALTCGAIDFSIAGNAALAGVVAAWVSQYTSSAAVALAVLGLAVVIGLAQGLVITQFLINPFIATLVLAGAYRGIAFLIGTSEGIRIDSGFIPVLGQKSSLGLPNSVWVLTAVAVAAAVTLHLTPFGRSLLAVGGNPEAARLAGISTRRVLVAGYLISSVCAAVGGILLAGRVLSGIPQAASDQELLVFSAVLLGGTSLWGGRASITGTLIGILMLNALSFGLALEYIPGAWQQAIQGALLIVAVWLLRLRDDERDPATLIRRLLEGRGSV